MLSCWGELVSWALDSLPMSRTWPKLQRAHEHSRAPRRSRGVFWLTLLVLQLMLLILELTLLVLEMMMLVLGLVLLFSGLIRLPYQALVQP